MAMLLSKKVYRELMFLFVVYSKLPHKASWKNCKNLKLSSSLQIPPPVVVIDVVSIDTQVEFSYSTSFEWTE
jgi:hypothetical protein